MKLAYVLASLILLAFAPPASSEEPRFQASFVFPPHEKHNHAPAVVECKNGDLLVSWYRGSGERSADDVAVFGARKRKGADHWSEPFVMADTPGFPDCNTAMMIDARGRLWLFWPVILANTWASCLTEYRYSDNYTSDGPPQWAWQGIITLKPANFESKMLAVLDDLIKQKKEPTPREELGAERVRERLKDKLSHRLGWQPRCKPTVLPSGRILLPLYTDTFSVSVMAVSDDAGQSWYGSEPLVGFGNIQPSVLRRNSGTLVAYMRENGGRKKIRVSESSDEGLTWGAVTELELPNPGSGLDALRLANGHWLLVYNDTVRKRNNLAISISDDEGRTWPITRHLEQNEKGSYHYPSMIQGADGTIHCVYTYSNDVGATMKHAAFNEEWVRAGDGAKAENK